MNSILCIYTYVLWNHGLKQHFRMFRFAKMPEKITKQWRTEKETIWLPNFFEGKDPFDGKQTDEKGLPAGGTDKRGSTVLPTATTPTDDTNDEF